MKFAGFLLIIALAAFAAEISTNSIFYETNKNAIHVLKWERNTNHMELRFTNRDRVNRYDLDYTATNVLVESSHEPILLGKSNGVWWIVFR